MKQQKPSDDLCSDQTASSEKPEAKKVWTKPTIDTIDLSFPRAGAHSRPYSKVVEMLQCLLQQAEKDAALKPNDADLKAHVIRLRRSLASFNARDVNPAPGNMWSGIHRR